MSITCILLSVVSFKMESSRKQKDKDMVSSNKSITDIQSFMLRFKRASLRYSFECEPILNEDRRPVPHLEDVVISDSGDSISLEEPSCV